MRILFVTISILLTGFSFSGCNGKNGMDPERVAIVEVATQMSWYSQTNGMPPTNWTQLKSVVNLESVTSLVKKQYSGNSFKDYYVFLEKPFWEEGPFERRIIFIRNTPLRKHQLYERPYIYVETNSIKSAFANEDHVQYLIKKNGVAIPDPYFVERWIYRIFTSILIVLFAWVILYLQKRRLKTLHPIPE